MIPESVGVATIVVRRDAGTLERIRFRWNEDSLGLLVSGRIFCGEPVSTSPENAPKRADGGDYKESRTAHRPA